MIQHPEYILKKWIVPPPPDSAWYAGQEDDVPALIHQILYNRGITTREAEKEFFSGAYAPDCNPSLLAGMDDAVTRILSALEDNRKIAIYGDYDVDGVTATALLYEALEGMGAVVCEYIPNRFDEGYGLNNTALQSLKDDGVDMVVTVDCGIRSVAEAEFSREIGLELIITDHHHPEAEVPPADVVINPKLPGQAYPYPDLAGVGVAYKLVQALLEKHSSSAAAAERWLDLVALGTVADLAPLTGENRSLVRAGLNLLRQGRRTGINALCRAAGVNQQTLTSTDIGFMLGPRLNAAGRLETALDSFHLLVSKDIDEAMRLSAGLNKQNTDRQEFTRATQQAAVDRIGDLAPDQYLLFVVDEAFNEGIVGLAASRLAEKYFRPAVVGTISEESTRCSCRSIPGFHITQALDECSDLLIRHGGHAAAAGFTVANIHREELQRRLEAIARRELAGQELAPQLQAAAEVKLMDMNVRLLSYLDLLQPTGYGNPECYFIARNLMVRSKRAIGADSKHLKLSLSDGWQTMDAICFRFGYLFSQLPPRVDVLFSFERNYYNGQVTLQMNVKDIQASE